LKTTSSNSNDSILGLKKFAKLLYGSPFDIKQFNKTTKEIENMQKELDEIVHENDIYSPVITVKKLIDTYEGIEWMRLLNGIFRDTNISMKQEDLVQVLNHRYLLQLSNVIRKQTKK
jgi:UDP-N-acetyl-D-mannosaminuronate dehydrogenase